jgi:Uma2 family endonuclease
MVELTKTRMTAAEFLQLPESSEIIELINGEVIMPPAPSDYHQANVGDIYFYLRQHVQKGTFRLAPTDVYLSEIDVVQPDIFWVSAENTVCVLVDGKFWRGAPDLIIEILSPSTARRDREAKFSLYEQHGVREYWMVEPEAAFVEVYSLQAGKYIRLGFFGLGETFKSPVLGNLDIAVDSFLKG